MKPVLLAAVVTLFLTFSSGQEIRPTSVNFGPVLIGHTSLPKNVSFTNTGDSDLTLTISISGPFAIPVNHCGSGVKIGTHCNVSVTYTPEALGSDTGWLAFNYGQGTASASLNGMGVNILPTTTTLKGPKAPVYVGGGGAQVLFTTKVTSTKGESIPDGEQVYLSCVNDHGAELNNVPATLSRGVATLQQWIAQIGLWSCHSDYNGDSQFDGSESKTIHFHAVGN